MKSIITRLKERISQISYFRSFLPGIRGKELVMLFYDIFFLGTAVVSPLLAKYSIDIILNGKNANLLAVLSVRSLLFFVLLAFARYHSMYIRESLRLRFSLILKTEMLRRIFYIPATSAHKKTLSEKVFRIDGDTENAISILVNIYSQIALPLLRLVSVFCIALWLNQAVTLAVLCLAPFIIFRIRYFSAKKQSIQRSWISDRIKVNKTLLDSLMHQIVIRAFGKEKAVRERFESDYMRNITLSLKRIKVAATSELVGDIFQKAIIIFVALWCGIQVINRAMSLGGLVSLTMYLALFMDSIKSIGNIWSGMLVGFVSLDNLSVFFKKDEMAAGREGTITPDKIEGAVLVKDLAFGYESGVPVLKGINLEIPKGSYTAIAGPIGSGKTTLINLILKILSPWAGAIYIDGTDAQDLRNGPFLEKIGVALQEPFLFNASIEENIRFYDDRIKRDDVVKACDIAGVRVFVEGLPDGYGTIIGEGGAMLSGGQRQKIAIARAAARRPAIFILDEAMSSLSSSDESLIFDNLRKSGFIKTAIIISHRLSTVKNADRIYLLQDGVIKDAGTHKDLLLRSDFYNRLYETQTQQGAVL